MPILKDLTYVIAKLKNVHTVIKVLKHVKNEYKIVLNKNVFHNAES